jgi:hypothetical protein
MSSFYKESNLEGTKELYDKSIIYKTDILRYAQKYSNVVDFNFAEKFFYGRVNRDFVSMELNENLVSLKEIPNSNNISDTRVINFVADAFSDLSRQFVKAAQTGAIKRGDPYLTNLIAFDAYKSAESLYSLYINNFFQAYKLKISQNNINFKNFDEFINHLKYFMMDICREYPFTKTGFVKSRHNNYLCSGLTIEISDLSFTNDQQKIDIFLNSPNFEYYLNACNSFGFMVDSSSPWKITLDVGSQDVIDDYMKKYSFKTLDQLLTIGYKKSHFSSFLNVKRLLLNLYNQVTTRKFTVVEDCGGFSRAKIITSEVYTEDKFNKLYSDQYFIKLYCSMRFFEEENKFSKQEQDQIITDIINLSRTKSIGSSLNTFERYVSQPFDYRGSLSYIVSEQEKREDT